LNDFILINKEQKKANIILYLCKQYNNGNEQHQQGGKVMFFAKNVLKPIHDKK